MNTSWRESRFLPVVLTPEEILARGEQLADALARRDAHEAQMRAERDDAKEELEVLEGEVSKLAKIVRARREERAVVCECTVSVELGIVEVRRLDTEDVIQTRAVEPHDRQRLQQELPGTRPGAQEEPPAPPADPQDQPGA
jgi:hypothetical protein